MRSFAQFINEMIQYKEQLIQELELSPVAVEHWIAGHSNPHPLVKTAVWQWLNDRQMEEDNLTQVNREAIKEIEYVLRRADLEGLIKMGAPADEYNGEAKDIVYHLSVSMTVDELQQAIWAVWATSFCVRHAGDLSRFRKVAEDIWPLKEKYDN